MKVSRWFSIATVSILALMALVLLRHRPALAQAGNDANGKKLFLTYCFLCHGTEGRGDGFAANNLQVRPRNLTNDAYMSKRTDEQLFEAISGGGAAFHGSIAMPYWRESLTKQQIWDLVAYIRILHRNPAVTGVAAQGAQLFTQYCWTCHGSTAKGDGPLAKVYHPRPRDLTDAAYLSSLTDRDLFNVISQGGPAVDRSPVMPAWGQTLKPEEIWDLVAYIRHISRR
jgi:cbb3-type cytochrome c oxidase subunit III